jgi:hypothetical protein
LSVLAGVAKHVRMGLDPLALTSSEAAEPRWCPASRYRRLGEAHLSFLRGFAELRFQKSGVFATGMGYS